LPAIREIRLSTPLGFIIIQSTNDQLVRISLDPDQGISEESEKDIPSCLRLAKKQFDEYFSGKRKSFSLPYLVSVGGSFQRIYDTLLHHPYGKTTSYAELAHQSGFKSGARAVGNAMARNPLPLLIPCHRVIRSNGTIGEYSLGGTQNKKLLLQLEASYAEEKV
jgi:methylated-DNA-[protein]-cysteine S-methyltransferase